MRSSRSRPSAPPIPRRCARSTRTSSFMPPASRPRPPPRGWPNIDGYFLPEPVTAIYSQGKQAHIPLLAGWNQDENALWVVDLKPKMSVAGLQEMAQKNFGLRAGDFLQSYSAANDEEALRAAEDFSGDSFIAFADWSWIDAQVKTGGAPVYRYLFELGSPGSPFHPGKKRRFPTPMKSSMSSATSTHGKEPCGGRRTMPCPGRCRTRGLTLRKPEIRMPRGYPTGLPIAKRMGGR